MTIREQIQSEAAMLVEYIQTLHPTQSGVADALAIARLLQKNVTSPDVTIEHKISSPSREFDEYGEEDNELMPTPTKRDTFVSGELTLDPSKFPTKPKPRPIEDIFGDYPAQITDAAIDRAELRDEKEIKNI